MKADPLPGEQGAQATADEAMSDPILPDACDRCSGPAGPDGAWCDQCIRTCREHTERLDLQRLPDLNTESKPWAAYFYARAGIPVHPLRPGSKLPATKNGFKDASTDLQLIRDHWRQNPRHNIGIATGHKFDVLDVDTKDGRPGAESLTRLRLAGLTVGVWAVATTPSGGRHILFTPSGGTATTATGPLGSTSAALAVTSLGRPHTPSKSLSPTAKSTSTRAPTSGHR